MLHHQDDVARRLSSRWREPPRVAIQDWLILGGNCVFVATGLVLLFAGKSSAVAILAFFSACLAGSIFTIRRKLREDAFEATQVSVQGGVPIRLSKTVYLVLAGGFLFVGLPLAVAPGFPLIVTGIGAALAVNGAVMVAGAALGYWPDGLIQFDPEGFTVGRRAWRARVDWDDIDHVWTVDYADNPLLCISLKPGARIVVSPPEATASALPRLRAGAPLDEADIVVNALRYGIELPALAAAVARYADDPAARAELGRRALPPV